MPYAHIFLYYFFPWHPCQWLLVLKFSHNLSQLARPGPRYAYQMVTQTMLRTVTVNSVIWYLCRSFCGSIAITNWYCYKKVLFSLRRAHCGLGYHLIREPWTGPRSILFFKFVTVSVLLFYFFGSRSFFRPKLDTRKLSDICRMYKISMTLKERAKEHFIF